MNAMPTPSGSGTPNWLKALYAILIALIIIVALGLIFG